MSATLLVNELTLIVSEAKRRNNELKTAAERSLQDLKALPSTSEQQLLADLSRRPAFIDPFLIACGTRTPKLSISGVTCLQRLVASKAIARSRLKETLDAFNACADLSLDIQLKVLQALPALLQSYARELQDELLAGALQLCASLQGVNVQTVSGVATATLNQLAAAVFDKVADEDKRASEVAATHEIPGQDGPITLRPAAFDAYRTFRDLVLAVEARPTKFVQLSALSPESALELIWSCLNTNLRLFFNHPELHSVLRANLLPAVTRPLSEKLPFSITVRSLKIMDLLLNRYFHRFHEEFEVVLGLLTDSLDPDNTTPWKRPVVLEVLRNFFARGSLIIEAYAVYDLAQDGKPVIQDLFAAFVRLAAEKPLAIGLGQQSTAPVQTRSSDSEQAAVDVAGGMAGMISSALGVTDTAMAGISSQWSVPRLPSLEQLDKADSPIVPETYIYTLVLECLDHLADSLARVVLPLTASRKQLATSATEPVQEENGHLAEQPPKRPSRSQSYRKDTVPLNPMELVDGAAAERVATVAALVTSCWPAILATCSTFLNASLEEQYYRNLIKAFQRFAQVAGLLRLKTPRDALMTTLAKSAVPPHILNAAMTETTKSATTPVPESPRLFSGSRALLSVENLATQASSLSLERRRSSIEPAIPMLSTRNLLCLRALINLAIALGPTLGDAFILVVDALRHADLILSSPVSQHWLRQAQGQKVAEVTAPLQSYATEVAAVESAASRLLENPSDFPNDSFMHVLSAFTRLLRDEGHNETETSSSASPLSSRPSTPRELSVTHVPGSTTASATKDREYQFVIPKIGVLAALNISRFVAYPPTESGWDVVVDSLLDVVCSVARARDARRAAADVLCRMAAETMIASMQEPAEHRARLQKQALVLLRRLVCDPSETLDEPTAVDMEIREDAMNTLQSIVERCGESILAGWEEVLLILRAAFEEDEPEKAETHMDLDEWSIVSSDLVTLKIGRIALGVTQLICSDFLDSLPMAMMPHLVESLHRFITQDEDVNMALTAITMTLGVADNLLVHDIGSGLDELVQQLDEPTELEDYVRGAVRTSRAAQLLLLLIRLRNIVSEAEGEVRNAAFQTICSIFKNHGNRLSAEGWNLVLRSVVLPIAGDDGRLYNPGITTTSDDTGPARVANEGMSKVILAGVSDLFAQHIRLVEQIKRLPSLWEVFLIRLEAYLDCEQHPLNEAVYSALSQVLAQIQDGLPVWTTPVYRAIALWLKRLPEHSATATIATDNQSAFIAYIECGAQLYRLARTTMGSPQTRKFIDNICVCVVNSNGPRYAADTNSMSPLQSKAIELLKSIRTEQPNIPSRLITAAAELALLYQYPSVDTTDGRGPTFIAISGEALKWLQELLGDYMSSDEIFESGALLTALQAFVRAIAGKYTFPARYKGVALWQRATSAVLALFEPLITTTNQHHLDVATRVDLWTEYVAIAAGIASAQGLEVEAASKDTPVDEAFDIDGFRAYSAIINSRLSDATLPDSLRTTYCRSLFEASIIHATERGEIPPLPRSPLESLLSIRRGRAKQVPYSLRERMSYVCFEELVNLASEQSTANMAQAAAPLLLLRLAVPIRAYIADQPLRGRSPQPLSELEELLYCFEKIKALRLHAEALAMDLVAQGQVGPNAHLHFLYPLLAKAVTVAGNRWYGADEVLVPLQATLEAINPVP